MQNTLIFIFTLIVLLVGTSASEDVEVKLVKTPQGAVKGYKKGNIFEFHGIPYATAPKGQDRFKPPLPAPTWLEPLDAVDKKVVCPQSVATTKQMPMKMYGDEYQMTEDCLIANVFKPDSEDKNLPVVVYVHGGAYQLGHGNLLTQQSLVEQGNIIAVTFNYRLGVHGFLCLGTDSVPGNAGMKDQVALLKWVKKNIASFGGNPDDVTIAGYSAGSSAVDLLVLSKMTRGLFHKVIPESGAAAAVWSTQQDPIDTAKSYARTFGIDTNHLHELEIFYKTTPLEELMKDSFMGNKNSTFAFVPCVEPDIGSERFLSDAPLNILKSGAFPTVPMLIGFANMEGKFRLNYFNLWKDRMNEKFSEFLPADLTFNNEEEKEKVANKIKTYYFGDKPVGDDTIQGYVDYFSDVVFAYSTLQSVKYQVKAGNKDVYLYEYSYVDDNIMSMSQFKNVRGADHVAQSAAISDSIFFGLVPVSEDYANVKTMMRKLWINFIKTGKPVPEPTGEFPRGWPPASAPEGAPHMSLDLAPQLRGPLLPERARFWDHIYGEFYRAPVAPELSRTRSEL